VVTEDGGRRPSVFCEYQKMQEAGVTPRPAPADQVAAVTRGQIAPERPGDVRYKDRRLLALYFDMSAMPVPDQLRAHPLPSSSQDTDGTGGPDGHPVFFRWRPRAAGFSPTIATNLENTVDKLFVGEAQGSTSPTATTAPPIRARPFGEDDTEFNLFNTNRQLAALQDGGPDAGQRSNEKEGADLLRQRPAAERRRQPGAVSGHNQRRHPRQRVLYSIDARGLVAQAPLGDATAGSQGRAGMYLGSSAMANAKQLSAVAGHAVRAGGGYGRKGAAGQ